MLVAFFGVVDAEAEGALDVAVAAPGMMGQLCARTPRDLSGDGRGEAPDCLCAMAKEDYLGALMG